MSLAHVLAALATLLAVAFAYVAFLILRFQVRVFLADPTVTFEFADEDQAGEVDGLTLEKLSFRAADGAELAGTLIKPTGGGAPRGLVVFAPEFGGDQQTWRRYAAFVPRAGWWLLAFDFRGTGKSAPWPGYVPRKWASDLETRDLEAALAHARTLDGGRFREVCLFGISRGGLASLEVASRDAGVRGVVLEGSGSTLEVIHSYTEKWSRVFAPERFCAAIPWWIYRAVSHLVLRIAEWRVGYQFLELAGHAAPASNGPCLFIHGERDRHVTPTMAKQAFDAFPGAKELWMVPGARHNGAVLKQPDAYRERVLAHLARIGEAEGARADAAAA